MIRSLLLALTGLGLLAAQDAGAQSPCRLNLFGITYPGPCSVTRKDGDIVISFRGATYTIERDQDDKSSGIFFQVKRDYNVRIAVVSARGECWVGEGIRFCAR